MKKTIKTNPAIDQIITRARSMKPGARAEFLRRHTMSEIGEIHAALVGEAKAKTPRPILEKRILAALAEPAPTVTTSKPLEQALAESPAATANAASWGAAMPEPGYVPPSGIGEEGAHDAPHGAAGDGPAADAATPDANAPTGDAGATPAKPARARKAAAPKEPTPAKERDARLPPVGTVISKKDRHGAVRAECKVVEGGIEYASKTYKSLSGAGLQASKDLGLKTTTCDGLAFWGLKKVAAGRAATKKNPVEAIEKLWSRYQEQVAAAAKASDADAKAQLHTALNQHLAAHSLLAAEVA